MLHLKAITPIFPPPHATSLARELSDSGVFTILQKMEKIFELKENYDSGKLFREDFEFRKTDVS